MKTIQEVLDNYKEYETFLEDRFGKRFCDFLTKEQAESIGFQFSEAYAKLRTIEEWTEENVIKQLEQDVKFGWEKCCHHRGISAELMACVVRSWCKVLENGLEDIEYGYYGDNVFITVDEKYGFGIT